MMHHNCNFRYSVDLKDVHYIFWQHSRSLSYTIHPQISRWKNNGLKKKKEKNRAEITKFEWKNKIGETLRTEHGGGGGGRGKLNGGFSKNINYQN